MYWALLLYPVKVCMEALLSWPIQPPKETFGVDNINHISPFELVVPVFPIQSAPASVGLTWLIRDLKVVVAPDVMTPRKRSCIIVAVAGE